MTKTLTHLFNFFLFAAISFAQELPQVADVQEQELQFTFDGQWLPDADPIEIGANNFKKLKNFRYKSIGEEKTGIEGIQGYTKINTTPLSTYTKIRSGIQLLSDRTTTSYVLVNAQDSSGDGRVFVNTTAIAEQGDFSATPLHTDDTDANVGRFSQAPGGNIVYSNGLETKIWAGDEMRVAGFYTVTTSARTLPKDETDAVNNTLDTTNNYVSVGVASGRKYFDVFTTRPIKAVKFYIKTPNDTASDLSCVYFNGTSFVAVTTPANGTKTGGIALVQDGIFSFDSTVGLAKPFHFEGLYLYAYQFYLTDGNADIYYVTVDAPFQDIGDIWDGVYRQPISFQVSNPLEFEDATLSVNSSVIGTAIGADISGLTSSGSMIAVFEERMAAINITMIAQEANTNVASLTVKYWNGAAYATVGTIVDGTTDSGGTKTLNQAGLISWDPPAIELERKKTQFGVTGYFYELTLSNTVPAICTIDLVTGVPAQKKLGTYAFSGIYKDRLMLVGDVAGKQVNRVDYSAPYQPDSINGLESSNDGKFSLFFGGADPITSAAQLFNRYGSNIFTSWVVFKRNELYMLTGDTPDAASTNTFRIFPISENIGNPAPLTLTSVELAYELGDSRRNLLLWLSDTGPMGFDGATPFPLPGIEHYFDPYGSKIINFSAIENSRAWYDAKNKEWNLLFPVGDNQTTCNVWVVFDLVNRKWYEKDTDTAQIPQFGVRVVDSSGATYTYGGIDTGYMMHLENGTSWDGVGIHQVVETGDFWPLGNSWDLSLIRQIKLWAVRIPEDLSVLVTHWPDTDETDIGIKLVNTGVFWKSTTTDAWVSSTLLNMALDLNTGLTRIVRTTSWQNLLGWTHRFEFESTTTDTEKGFQPLGWAIRVRPERRDQLSNED